MEELQELVRIVAQRRLKKIDILNNPDAHKDSRSIISRLYHGILNGKLKSDEEASLFLGYKKDSIAWRSFKSRFRYRLYNSLFFIDLSGTTFTEFTRAEYECSRGQHLVRVLSWFWARKASVKICKTMLSKAEQFQFSEYAVFYLRMLVLKSANSENKNDYLRYSGQLQMWWKKWIREEEAIVMYQKIQNLYANTVTIVPEAAQMALSLTKEIEKEFIHLDTFILRFYYYRLKGLGNYIAGHYQLSIDAWTDLEVYLKNNPLFSTSARLGEAALQKMVNCMHLKQLEQGKQCAKECLLYFSIGSLNRLIFYEYYALLLIYCEEYQEALDIKAQVLQEVHLKEMPKGYLEKWKLIQYFILVLPDDKTKIKPEIPFKLSKFLNDFERIDKDKSGVYMLLIIIELCFYLKHKRHTEWVSRIQVIKNYRNRYLPKNGSRRFQIFIKMLMILESTDLNYELAIINSKTWYQKLCDIQYLHPGDLEGMEIIPLEKLWTYILSYVQDFYKP